MLKCYNIPLNNKFDISAGDLVDPFIDLLCKFYCAYKNIDEERCLIPAFIEFEEIDSLISDSYKKICAKPLSDINIDNIIDLNAKARLAIYSWCNHQIYQTYNLSIFSNRNIIFIDKRNNIVFSNLKSEINQENLLEDKIIQLCVKSNLLLELSKYITSNELKLLTNNVLSKLTVSSPNNVAKLEQTTQLKCLFIKKEWLNANLFDEPAAANDFWINETYAKKISLNIETLEKVSILRNKSDNEIGYVVNDSDVFLSIQDPSKVIKPDKLVEYYWHLFNQDIYKRPIQLPRMTIALVEQFKDALKSDELTFLLSNLKKNLYLQNNCIVPEKYTHFFESCISFDELEHVENYEFFVRENELDENSVLGIYQNTRNKSDKHYNLIHWFRGASGGKIERYKSRKSNLTPKNKLAILKPEISFYFQEKFFEDFVETMLTEMSMKFRSNYTFSYKGGRDGEIDFIVFTGRKLYIIETKTKLNVDNIEKTIRNVEYFNSAFSIISENIDYLILAPYSDNSCERYKSNFEEKSMYNTNRANLATLPYKFNLPIRDKTITCIAEPSYEKLKNLLQEIFI